MPPPNPEREGYMIYAGEHARSVADEAMRLAIGAATLGFAVPNPYPDLAPSAEPHIPVAGGEASLEDAATHLGYITRDEIIRALYTPDVPDQQFRLAA